MWKRLAFLGVLAAAAVAAVKTLRPKPAFETAERDAAEWPPLDLPSGATSPSTSAAAATATKAWAEPNSDGSCPPGFPVKLKLSSGIFHVPGGLSYDRTNPDRCYADPASAEADGFRQSQR